MEPGNSGETVFITFFSLFFFQYVYKTDNFEYKVSVIKEASTIFGGGGFVFLHGHGLYELCFYHIYIQIDSYTEIKKDHGVLELLKSKI